MYVRYALYCQAIMFEGTYFIHGSNFDQLFLPHSCFKNVERVNAILYTCLMICFALYRVCPLWTWIADLWMAVCPRTWHQTSQLLRWFRKLVDSRAGDGYLGVPTLR